MKGLFMFGCCFWPFMHIIRSEVQSTNVKLNKTGVSSFCCRKFYLGNPKLRLFTQTQTQNKNTFYLYVSQENIYCRKGVPNNVSNDLPHPIVYCNGAESALKLLGVHLDATEPLPHPRGLALPLQYQWI